MDIQIFIDKVPVEGGQGKGAGLIMGKNILKIERLRVEVGGKEILTDFSLTVKPGETHAIMGPNGSGWLDFGSFGSSRWPGNRDIHHRAGWNWRGHAGPGGLHVQGERISMIHFTGRLD